jgi:hypothetical protein
VRGKGDGRSMERPVAAPRIDQQLRSDRNLARAGAYSR